jgi:hypothetical protein
MQDQRIPAEQHSTRLSEDEIDNTVVGFLLDKPWWPWSLEEIGREIGDRPDAEDAVARLAGAGLVHRLGDFAFPTRSLRRASKLRLDTPD